MRTYYVTLLFGNTAHYQSVVKAKNIFNAMKRANKEWRKENFTNGLDDGLDTCCGATNCHINISLTQNFPDFED